MSLPGNINQLLIGAAASSGAATAEGPIKSVRFNNDDTAYLERTPTSVGNRKKFTYSTWVKRSDLSSATNYALFSVGVSNYNIFGFRSNGKLRLEGNSPSMDIHTGSLFRDASAWYHIVLTVDTSQSTAADRVKIYVNNSLQSDDGSASYPALDSEFDINTLNPHAIGRYATSRYFDGYMTATIFADGQALDPSSFGAYDDNGVWQAKTIDANLLTDTIAQGTGAKSLYNLGANLATKASPSTFRTDPLASNLQTAVAGDSSDEVSHSIRGSGSALTLTNTSVTFNQTGYYYSDAFLIQTAGAACEVAETSANKPGTSDFCVEFWINPTTTPANSGLFSYGDYNTAGSFGMMTTGSNNLRVDMHDGVTSGARLSVSGGLQTGWQHFALTRSGTTCTLYRNGVSQGTWTIDASADFTPASNPRYVIGNRLGLPFSSYNITSYFQDFRVYVGTAKYSGNFTLPSDANTNSFHLFDFANESGIGDDSSGNNNDWTANNFNTSSGLFPTPPATGSVYSNNYIGYYLNGNPPLFLVYDPSGANRGDSITHGASTGTTWVVDDVLQWAIDWSAGKMWLGRNNTWYESGDPAGGTNPGVSSFDTSYNYYLALGYDSPNFELQVPASPSYTPPSGFTYWGGAAISTWRNSGTNQGGVVDAFKTAIPKSGKTYIEAIIKGGFTTYATLGLANFGESTVVTDILRDVPTNKNQSDTGVGGEVSGNYATWNTLYGKNEIIEDGNLTAKSSTGYAIIASTLAMTSGKYYMEYTYDKNGGNYITFGVSQTNRDGEQGSGVTDTAEDFGFKCWDAGFYSQTNGTNQHNYSSSVSDGDVLSLAFDADAGKLWVAKNGTWMTNASGTGDPANGNNPDFSSLTYSGGYFFMAGPYVDGVTNILIGNFGQSSWTYAAPSGFKALCTSNIAEVTIPDGAKHMDAVLYTGNASSQTISGYEFEPSLLWLKSRNNANNNWLSDAMRGAGYVIFSNATSSEQDYTAYLTSFTSDGFTLANNSDVNNASDPVASWSWDAGTPPTRTHTQPAYYSSTTLYTTAADVVANATPRSAGDAISSEYIYIVTNSGGRIGQKLFDNTGSLPSTWYLLMYQNSAWESYGSYNNSSDVPLFKWKQVFDNTFNTYTIANDVELNIISNGTSPALVSATLPTLFTTTDDGAVVNTDGDITSRVRANPSVGFSIVMWTSIPWTGSAVNRQVGHGLGAAPAFIITKGTENAAGWYCYHQDLDPSNPEDWYLTLNTNTQRSTLADSWGPNKPDTTTFGDRLLGFSDNQTALAYVFTPIEGFSSFGKYEGNADPGGEGPFVFTNFQPSFVLVKYIDSAGQWYIYDYKRSPQNVAYQTLVASQTDVENTSDANFKIDILSNGFKLRQTNGPNNVGTYIYAAFARNPFRANGGLAR